MLSSRKKENNTINKNQNKTNLKKKNKLKQAPAQYVTPIELYNGMQIVSTSDFLVDIRKPEDYSQFYLPRSFNIPFNAEDDSLEIIEQNLNMQTLSKWRSRYNSRIILMDYNSEKGNVSPEMKTAYILTSEHGKESNHVFILNGGLKIFYDRYFFFFLGENTPPLPPRVSGPRSHAKIVRTPRRLPSQIDESLFLGKYDHVKERAVLKQLGITHIVNVSRDLACCFEDDRDLGVVYYRVPVDDVLHAPIDEYFEEAIAFIRNAEDKGGKIVIHCAMGKSRSVTILAAFLIKTRHLDAAEALARIRTCRPLIAPNSGFTRRLREYASHVLWEENDDEDEEKKDQEKNEKDQDTENR
eukprot:gb/GECH01012955.1/.p1 GENE.gb/GECH01012955.1/~~gb/GECH01012955.1/.p1  ORF type:complete len:355 (+),score=86.21 gb/GECH01012955.1/:1-1065(+)